MHVKMIDADDMAAVKKARGVPETEASCHTATVEGYTIEGHVPAREIKRLLGSAPTRSASARRACRSALQAWMVERMNRIRSCSSRDGTKQVFAEYP